MTALQAGPPESWDITSRIRRDDELVLTTQALTAGTDETMLSRFGDDCWDLAPAIFRENVPRSVTVVNFAALHDPLQRLTAKEFLWARLNEPSPSPTQARLAPTCVRAALADLTKFMAFVSRHLGVFALYKIDQALLDAYLAELRGEQGRTPDRVTHLLNTPIDLDRYSPFLTLGGFSCRPWRGRPSVRIAGLSPQPQSADNRTPRIPEPVIAALLRWSLKYIDHFAADVFAARAEYEALEWNAAHRDKRQATPALLDRMDAYIGRRCAEGRGIPVSPHNRGGRSQAMGNGTEATINFHLIALQLGSDARFLIGRPTLRERLERAVERLGPEIGGMEFPISVDPDTGLPWRARFDERSLVEEERMLLAAAYVVCAYLTGMRDSELQAMRVGCHSVSNSADGMVERHRIKSITYKARDRSGEEAEWVTVAPVARAIGIVERLNPPSQRSARSSRQLFVGWTGSSPCRRPTVVVHAAAVSSDTRLVHREPPLRHRCRQDSVQTRFDCHVRRLCGVDPLWLPPRG